MKFGMLKNNNRWGSRIRVMLQTACAIGLMLIAASCGESPGYSYTVGGIVSGLAGSGLVLQNNGADDLTISSNGTFSLPHAVPDGAAYNVTVATQPGGLNQACAVVNGSGVIGGIVNNIQINCTQPPPRFAVDSATSAKYAYAVNYATTANTAYSIAADTGVLSTNGTAGTTGANPNSVTVATVGTNQYAYVPNFGEGTVSMWSIGSDGKLISLDPATKVAGTNPSSVTIHPTLNVAYVTNFGSNNISIYSIDSGTGALTAVSGSPVNAGANPSSITIHPTKNVAYVTNSGANTLSVYTITSTGTDDGKLTAQGTAVETGSNPGRVVIDSTGVYAYVANTGSNSISVYTINSTDGSLSPGTPASTGSNPIAIYKVSITGGEFLYVPIFRANAIAVYTIGSGGALTAGTAVATGTNPYAMAIVKIDDTHIFAYAVNYNSNNISCYSIDAASGALTEISGSSPIGAGTNPYAITISKTSSTSNVYVAHVLNAGSGDISTYTIDGSTGALTLKGTTSY